MQYVVLLFHDQFISDLGPPRPLLLTAAVMGVVSYTAPPFDTENGLLTSTASPGETLQGFT